MKSTSAAQSLEVEETPSDRSMEGTLSAQFRLNFVARPWVSWLLIAYEALALQISLGLGYLIRLALIPYWPITLQSETYQKLSIIMLALPLGSVAFGLYPGYGLTPVERLRRRTSLIFSFFVFLMIGDYLILGSALSRGVLLITMILALVLIPPLKNSAISLMTRLGWWGTPVVILGAAATGQAVVEGLLEQPNLGFHPVAFYDDDYRKWGTTIQGIPVVGPVQGASELAGKVRHVIVAMPGAGRKRLVQLSESLPFPQIMVIPDLLGIQSLWVTARDLSGSVGLELRKNLLMRHNWYIKRSMDYLLGVPLFLCSLPLLALSALWIWVVNPGASPFFSHEREGFGGRMIRVWKIRTMYCNAETLLLDYLKENPSAHEEWRRFFKLRHDPRIIPGIGHFLRQTSLDELPQLWNVLRGEMSLVGPRPFPLYHLNSFEPTFRAMRRSVLPGMTGLWQLSARSNGDLKVQEGLDTYYIRNWSIWIDLNLLYRTFWIVVRRKGAY